MKYLVVGFCLLLSGCGAFERMFVGITGEMTYKCSKHGVEYVQSDSGIARSDDIHGIL